MLERMSVGGGRRRPQFMARPPGIAGVPPGLNYLTSEVYLEYMTFRHSRRTSRSGISDASRPSPCTSTGGNVRRFVATCSLMTCVMLAVVGNKCQRNRVLVFSCVYHVEVIIYSRICLVIVNNT